MFKILHIPSGLLVYNIFITHKEATEFLARGSWNYLSVSDSGEHYLSVYSHGQATIRKFNCYEYDIMEVPDYYYYEPQLDF